LKSDGTIVAWGRNDYGESTAPALNTGFVAIASGGSYSLAIKGAPLTVVDERERDASFGARPVIRALAPNPTASFTTILFETFLPGFLTLDIYDVGGRLLRTVALGNVTPGVHRTDSAALSRPNR
jgi:hypothetical protein